jgi:hypothetical protein
VKDFVTQSGQSESERNPTRGFRLEASSAGDPPKRLFKLPRNSAF